MYPWLEMPSAKTTPTVARIPHTSVPHNNAPRYATLCALALFSIALAITVIHGIRSAPTQFTYEHAEIAADVATTARTFATQGVFHLGAVPVNNNPPIGPTDFYTHWPPLLPILLSQCFRAFGATERVTHLFMLAVLIVTALLIFQLGRRWLGTTGGALAGYFWLTLPVEVQFGHLAAQQSLALLFMVAAVLAIYSSRPKLAAALLFLGVLSSWEAALVLAGIWLAVRTNAASRESAIAATIGVAAALACTTAIFFLSSKALALGAIQTLKYYAGLSPLYSKTILWNGPVLTFGQQIFLIVLHHIFGLGVIGLFAIVRALWIRPTNGRLLLFALAAPWILWTIFLRNHMAIHHFELMIAAPVVALALAWLALPSDWTTATTLQASLLVIAAALQLLLFPHVPGAPNATSVVNYGLALRTSTPPNAIILSPLDSAVPLFYSERHLVRGIANQSILRQELPIVRQQFPSAPIYLAVLPNQSSEFVSTLHADTFPQSSPDAIIVALH